MVAPIRPPDSNAPHAAPPLGAAARVMPDEVAKRVDQLFREELATNPYDNPARVKELRDERLALLRDHHPNLDAVLADKHAQAERASDAAAGQIGLSNAPRD